MRRADLDQLCALWEQCTCALLEDTAHLPCTATQVEDTEDGESVEFCFAGSCSLRVEVRASAACRRMVAQMAGGDLPDDSGELTAEHEQSWLHMLDTLIARWTAAVTRHAGLSLRLHECSDGGDAVAEASRSFAVQAGDATLPFALHIAQMPAAEQSAELGNVELLLDVELQATLRFGTREMLLGEVLDLGPGDVVPLDRPVQAPVELVVGDRIVARGDVVVVDGNYGLRVTELAMPQQRLESIRCLF